MTTKPTPAQQRRFCPKYKTETYRDASGDCKPCVKVRTTAWRAARYAANPEIFKVSSDAWRLANPQKAKAARAAWRAAHPEKQRVANAAWAKANPIALRIHNQNRRALRKAAGGKLSKGLAEKLLKLQKGKCPCCKQPLGDDYHMDHIIPLALGGSNTDENMQLLRKVCNLQKNAKHPVDFMQKRGFLL